MSPKIKTLIVDDDQNFATMMQKTLESKNCHVIVVKNTKQALSTCLTQNIDIVFIDCILLSEQGFVLAKKIREYLGMSLDIVMMSGILEQKSISTQVLDTLDFIRKPISDHCLEGYITKAKDRLLCDSEKQFLLKIFNPNILQKDKLKHVLSLHHSTGVEFVLILLALLDSKEFGYIKFSIEGHQIQHTVFFDKGMIQDYNRESTKDFLDWFIEKQYISKEEAKQFQNRSSDNLIDAMIQAFCIGSFQATLAKIDLLTTYLTQTFESPSIKFQIKLFTVKSNQMLAFSRHDLANFVLESHIENFSHFLKPLFGEDILKLSLKFDSQSEGIEYHSSVMPIVRQLKEGIKINALSLKDSMLYKYLLYILIKGNVYFSDFFGELKYAYLYKRYEKLNLFLKNKNSAFVFQLIGNQSESQLSKHKELINGIYQSFVKLNHPDKLLVNLPANLLKLITEALDRMKHHRNVLIEAKGKKADKVNAKNQEIAQSILTEQKKASCQSYLEQGKPEKAFEIIKGISEESILNDGVWQILYLWTYLLSDKKLSFDKHMIKKYLANISSDIALKKQYIFHYVLGLYYEEQGQYQKALSMYGNTKKIKPSFHVVYTDINRVLRKDKTNSKNNLFKKVTDILSIKNKKAS